MHSETALTRPDTSLPSPRLGSYAINSYLPEVTKEKRPKSLEKEAFHRSLCLVEPKIKTCGSGCVSDVSLMQSKSKHDHVYFKGNVITCSQHRLCAHCSKIKSGERRKTIESLFESKGFQELQSYFITLGSQRSFRSYKELRKMTQKAFNLLHLSLRKQYRSLVGFVKVIEVTLSRSNGSKNYHLHCVFSFRSRPEGLDRYVKRRWVEACQSAGLVAAEQAQDVREIRQKRGLKRYLSKSLAIEMTHEHSKKGRGNTFTIAGLVNEWHFKRKEHHRKWLKAYNDGMKGARTFSISSALKEMIDRKEEEEQVEEAIELVHLPQWAYNALGKNKAAYRFLALYEASDVSIQEMIGLEGNVIMLTAERLLNECRIADFQTFAFLFGKRLNLYSPSSIDAFKEDFLDFVRGLQGD